MVFKYNRTSNRCSGWSEITMTRAINGTKCSIRQAALRNGIPYATLQKHFKKVTSIQRLGRFKALFKYNEEQQFVDFIKEVDGPFYGITTKDLCELVCQFAEKNNIKHPFKNGMACHQWYSNFMSRHPELSLRVPEPTSIARARGFNRPQVELFFKNLASVREKYNFSLDDIYNADETGIQTSAKKPPKVLSLKCKRQVGSISSAERGQLVTAVCISCLQGVIL